MNLLQVANSCDERCNPDSCCNTDVDGKTECILFFSELKMKKLKKIWFILEIINFRKPFKNELYK